VVAVVFLRYHQKHQLTPSQPVPTLYHLDSISIPSRRRVEQVINETSTKIDDSRQNDLNDPQRRPIMHTFFEPISKKHKRWSTRNQGSGMSTPEAHKQLLDAWENAWEEAGWTTRILTLEDAMAYPKYEEIRESLEKGIFGEYDILCFLRWFAMVSVGGGWMSDYDVFPLAENIPLIITGKIADQNYSRLRKKIESSKWSNNGGIPLPNNGKFTVYDNGGVTPSLVSGSKKDWDRMARGLIQMELLHLDGFYSDMLALDDYDDAHPQDVVKEHSVAWRLSDVMSGLREIDCQKVWGKKNKFWAVHFSHWNVKDSVNKGVLKEGLGRDDRPQIAVDFLHDWKHQCANGTKCFDGTLTTCY